MEIHPYYLSFRKRVFDVVFSLILLILSMPIFLIIGLAILFSSGWPIFYLQKRSGLNKKTFKIIKFRTMYVGAQKNQWRYQKDSTAPYPMYKNWTDPRFVGVGKWLSKTGLDELPQLINILQGEMSFVGPRPLPIHEAEKLNKTWNFRYKMKPGVFSEWSCSNQIVTLSEWKKLDQKLIKNGGWKYELRLIKKTLQKIL